MLYWLMKSEPHVFSFDDLLKRHGNKTHWEGVRNYQARNFMRDKMRKGDLALFYHSNCQPPGVVGIVEVVREAYPDHTQFDPESEYFDPKATEGNPRWMMVDVRRKKALKSYVSLAQMRENPRLEGMPTLQKFQRLSVQPIEKRHFEEVLKMGGL